MAAPIYQSVRFENGGVVAAAGNGGDGSGDKRHPRDLPADKQDVPAADSDPDLSGDSDLDNLEKWPITPDLRQVDGVWGRNCSKEQKFLPRQLFPQRNGKHMATCIDCRVKRKASKRKRRDRILKAVSASLPKSRIREHRRQTASKKKKTIRKEKREPAESEADADAEDFVDEDDRNQDPPAGRATGGDSCHGENGWSDEEYEFLLSLRNFIDWESVEGYESLLSLRDCIDWESGCIPAWSSLFFRY